MATQPITQPGEVVPQEGPKTSRPSQDIIDAMKKMIARSDRQEQFPRRWEVREARKQRFFLRGMQHIVWNADQSSYQLTSAGGGPTSPQSAVEPQYQQNYNIYRGYGKSFISVFCQNTPGTRFEPEDPMSSMDITGASEADKMKKIIEKFNDPRTLQMDVARLLYTDGRVLAYTRFVRDAQRFGTDEEGNPRGREVVDIYGTLESKVPIYLRDINDWPYARISTEHDINTIKAMFPDSAKEITSGVRNNSDEDYARFARMSVNEGTYMLSGTGDNMSDFITYHRQWFRPSMYWMLEDALRDKMLQMYPDGLYCGFAGDTYCEARNESLDDHISVMHALPGDGQNSSSLGQDVVPVQEAFNDLMNLSMEYYEYGIPATWVDQELVDDEAFAEQDSEAGAHYPVARKTGEAMANHFYEESALQPPPEMLKHMENLQGPLAQFLTGQQPALFGADMPDQKTASGYAMARQQALGLMTIVWLPFTQFYARIMLQAVESAAKNRGLDEKVSVMLPGETAEDVVSVNIADLQGNLLAFPDTSEAFPESYSAKQATYKMLMEQSVQNPALQAILMQPDNLELGKNLIGLEDLVVPGAESRNKQLKEIAEMLKSVPTPNMPGIDAAIAGNPNPTAAPPPIAKSSVPIDPDFDDHAVEFEEVKRWLNSEEGQDAKVKNPEGFDNVRLHGLEHKAILDQQAQQQAMMQMMAKGAQNAGNDGSPSGSPAGK